MSCLIVGCGYLGRRVARLLVERGEVVHGTARSDGRAAELERLGVRPVLVDVLDRDSLSRLPTVDRVLYCVGYDRSAGPSMRQVYVDGLANALDALKGRARRVVYTSSTSVYGRNDGGWVTEDSPADSTTESGRISRDAEATAEFRCSEAGMELVVLRYAGLYGPGRVIRRAAIERGETLVGDPEKFLNMIHIDDAAHAAVLALDAPGAAGRLYLVADDHPHPRRVFYERAAELLGAPRPVFAPADPGSPAALRDESNKRIANRRIREELGLVLEHPDVVGGLAAAIAAS